MICMHSLQGEVKGQAVVAHLDVETLSLHFLADALVVLEVIKLRR